MPERWIAENSIVIQEIAHNFKMMKKRKGFDWVSNWICKEPMIGLSEISSRCVV